MKREGVRFTAAGFPDMSKRQVAQVHGYVVDMVRTGRSTRKVPTSFLLICAVYELAMHAAFMQRKLEQFMVGAATAAPAREVARLALMMLHKLKDLPDDHAREAYLALLIGDDDDTETTPPTGGTAH